MRNNENKFFLDVFNEHHINLYRLLLIIEQLQYNRKKRKVLTLEKLCIFDSIISDNYLTNIVYQHFFPEESWNEYEKEKTLINPPQTLKSVMKSDNVRNSVIELHALGLLQIEFVKGEIFLSITDSLDIDIQNPLIDEWLQNIHKVKSLISKSFNQLILSLKGALYE